MASDFKQRVAKAVDILIAEHNLREPSSLALYTPLRIDGRWEWNRFSTPDGLLLLDLDVVKGEGAKQPEQQMVVLAGVLVQSEETTSLNIQNPWGKAAIFNLPGGVWVDVQAPSIANDGRIVRARANITFGQVLFVAPKPSSTVGKAQNEYKQRTAILTRVEHASNDATVLHVPQGIAAAALAKEIWKKAGTFLKGDL